MKQPILLVLSSALALASLSGCGRSEDEVKKLVQLQSEVSQLHGDIYKKMTELGKVAGQPDELLARQEAWLASHPRQRTVFQNDDIDSAKQRISSAFDAIDSWKTLPSETYEEQVKKLTSDREFLKSAISKIDAAIKAASEASESHKKILARLTSSTGKPKQ
jgi:chromosome segregation ATPase